MTRNIIGLLIGAIFLLPSCKKFLDREPINVSTDVNFWKNEAEANSGIAGGYGLLRAAINGPDGIGHYAWGDLPTDEFAFAQPFNADYAAATQINWAFAVPRTETGRFMFRLRRFDNFYRVIDQANRCMKFIPQIPLNQYTSSNATAVQQRLVAEAYFLRAFSYFYMARIWGDVPLVLETVADPTQSENLPRTSQDVILDQAIKDLEFAIPSLTWNYPVTNDRAVRANRGAAYALLAHIYAWRGASDNASYAKAASAADSVIIKGGYSLVNRNNMLTIYQGKSSEGIFEIAESAVNEGNATGIAARTLKTPYLLTNTGNSAMPLEQATLYSRFYTDTVNDLRAKRTFAFLGTTDPISIKYSNITYTSTAANGQPASPIARNNIVIFRLADIKLLRAEALAAMNSFGPARIILDEIRIAAGLGASTATDANLFEAIIDERGRELFLEGHRYYDLVRLGKKTGILKFDAGTSSRMNSTDFQQGKYVWPIEPSLIYINPLFTQTPYWSNKM